MSDHRSLRRLLGPLTPLYRSALAVREFRLRTGQEPVRRLRSPVISIGNLSTGGSGKTPLTIALATALTERGFHIDVLSRGYGRQSDLASRVDPAGTADRFGDEPLLIAQQAAVPVYVARHRYEAGLLAEAEVQQLRSEKQHSRIHLLDDGFQHRQLHRDIDVLVLNRQDWTDRLLPAGNLREPLRAARRASVFAIPAEDPQLEAELKAWDWQGRVWRIHRKTEIPAVAGPVLAFCGIARPGQFFAGLAASGLRIAGKKAFRDHHRFSHADIDGLLASAQAVGATAFITTEKDRIRLGTLASALSASVPLLTARLHVEIEDPDQAIDWLVAQLGRGRPHPPL